MREKMLNVLEALFAAEKQTLDAMKEERRAIKPRAVWSSECVNRICSLPEKIDDREYGIMRGPGKNSPPGAQALSGKGSRRWGKSAAGCLRKR